MPDASPLRRRRPPRTSALVASAVAGVAGGVLVFLVVLNLTGARSSRQAATAAFEVGSARQLARAVAREGPLLFPDLLNRSRDIYVQHLGGDDWRAFEAHAPGAPRRCLLRWEPDSRSFVDSCDGRTFPADGTGLTSYPARVDAKGVLTVDLSPPASAPIPVPATTSPD